jgi:hypothetical protein
VKIIYALKNLNGKAADGVIFPSKTGARLVQNFRGQPRFFAGRLTCIEYRVVLFKQDKIQMQDFYHEFKPALVTRVGHLRCPMFTINASDIFGSRVKIFQFAD